MFRIAALLVFAATLAACDIVSNGLSYARAVESDLEAATGVKPEVGFKWSNGRLVEVTVQFPRLYDAKPLREVAETVRAAVGKEFKEMPRHLVLSFALEKTASGTTARLGGLD